MYLNYINRFRGVAILFVVFGHCVPLIDWSDHSVKRAFVSFFSEGTTLFVFISGYLFCHLKEKYRFSIYYRSKINNVVIPYLIVSLPAILLYVLEVKTDHRWILTSEFASWHWAKQVCVFYLTGAHLGPLWYIPMAVLLIMVSPILLHIQRKGLLKYLLPLFLLLSVFFVKPELNDSPWRAFLHYLFVYGLGMVCSDYKSAINKYLMNKAVFVLLIGFFLCFFILGVFYGNQILFIQKIFLIFLILSIFLRFEHIGRVKFLEEVAMVSFGLYFIHGYVIAFFALIKMKLNLGLTVDAYFFVVSFLALGLSSSIVIVVKKIFRSKSRFIIGS